MLKLQMDSDSAMENYCRLISAKLELASALINKLKAAAPGVNTPDLLPAVDAIRLRFSLCTGHLLLQSGNEVSRAAARDEFRRVVAAEDFLAALDAVVRRALVAYGAADMLAGQQPPARTAARGPAPKKSRPGFREVRQMLDQYEGHASFEPKAVDTAAQDDIPFNVCRDCCEQMSVCPETSELACSSCGKVYALAGTVFEESQYFGQEGQKIKSGYFNPNRHFRFWMDHILAREPEEELGDPNNPANLAGELLFQRLRAIIRRDRKILRLLTVDDVRSMLREIGRTDLNKNAPLIMRRLTGVGPPPLPESICQRVEKLFSIAIEISTRVRPAGRTNRNYYPYYIYKILDAILPPDGAPGGEARRILYYIYMQGQDTLDKNDHEWAEICQDLTDIEWVPTIRQDAQKYKPV